MCGINGIYTFEQRLPQTHVEAMNNALAHRGPDADGCFSEGPVWLGHRRLSIIDLSERANQPLHDAEGRYSLVYNGELYNFSELKAALADYPFKTETDSEVVLAAWKRWGANCMLRFNGMFAFALWDKERQELHLVRDRMGIKPLYYYASEQGIVFSSELRALLASDLVPRKLNQTGLIDYLRYQTVHAPNTIVEGVKMLEPGHYRVINHEGQHTHSYWNLVDKFDPSIKDRPLKEVESEVKERFFKAVERRMVADVPFGAFLSGGIDSSAVVGAMSEVSQRQVKTFSVVFDEAEFSEGPYAQIIAKKFKTDHQEIKLTANHFLETLPEALAAMDHPGGDGPNTYVVSKATKEAGVTMALSGLGGDELFAGYDIFKRSLSLETKKWLLSFPVFMRRMAGGVMKMTRPGAASDKIAETLQLGYFDLDHTYPISRQVLLDKTVRKLSGRDQLPANQVKEIATVLTGYGSSGFRFPLLSQVGINEIHTYLQNVLLRDSDQMSMAVALEVRVPFLDHELVEYVMNISDRQKYPRTPKQLLTESLGDLLPREIIDRPKMGFTLPWAHWLKNEMRDLVESRLHALGARGFLVEHELMKLWQAFQKNDPRVTWSRIWPLVVLEDWLERNGIEA